MVDVRSQVSEMSEAQRAALAAPHQVSSRPRRLPRCGSRREHRRWEAWRLSRWRWSFAEHVRATRILVIEPNTHPVPEVTHTVGESTVEVSAHYLRDRLGLGDHLSTSHIRKMGLRMFFSHERQHRYRAADGARKLLVRATGDLPNRPGQVGERAQPTLPGRRRRHLLRPCAFSRTRVRESSAHDDRPERRRSHAHDGPVGGRRVGPQPDAAPATGAQAGQRARLQRSVVSRRNGARRRPVE